MSVASQPSAEARVKALYYIMQSAEVLSQDIIVVQHLAERCMKCVQQHKLRCTALLQNKLGGGEGIEGLYGSLTRTGMQKVLHSLSKSCGLDHTSRLVDIGAGLGR